jgi:hypothetical protein
MLEMCNTHFRTNYQQAPREHQIIQTVTKQDPMHPGTLQKNRLVLINMIPNELTEQGKDLY